MPVLKSGVSFACRKVLPSVLIERPPVGMDMMRLLIAKAEEQEKKEIIANMRDAMPLLAQKYPDHMAQVFDILMSSAEGDDVLKATALRKGFFCVPAAAENHDSAVALVESMTAHVADDPGMREIFVDQACETLVKIAGKSSSPGLISATQSVIANDREMGALYIEKALSSLQDIVFRDVLKKGDERISTAVILSLISVAGTNERQRSAVFEKAIEVLPLMTEKNASDAAGLLDILAKEMSDRGALAALLVNKGSEALERMARADVRIAQKCVGVLIGAAGTDKDLLGTAVDKSCGILRLVGEKDAEGATHLYNQILSVVSMDPSQPAIFSDVALSKKVDHVHQALVLRNLVPAEKQIIVSGSKSYLSAEFEAEARTSNAFTYSGTGAKHFRNIFNFLSKSGEYMKDAPMLKDVIRERLNGKDRLQPLAWGSSY